MTPDIDHDFDHDDFGTTVRRTLLLPLGAAFAGGTLGAALGFWVIAPWAVSAYGLPAWLELLGLFGGALGGLWTGWGLGGVAAVVLGVGR